MNACIYLGAAYQAGRKRPKTAAVYLPGTRHPGGCFWADNDIASGVTCIILSYIRYENEHPAAII